MSDLLIVDDDPIELAYLEATLSAGGDRVYTANGGHRALDILDSRRRLDLMVTDVMLPGLNGFNLARMARMRRPMLKIIYLSTADGALFAREQGAKLGRLLHKSIEPQDLQREIENALISAWPPTAENIKICNFSSDQIKRYLF